MGRGSQLAKARSGRGAQRIERKLLDVLAVTNEIYVELDRERTIIDVSPRIDELFGIKPSQIIGRKTAELPDASLNDNGVLAFREAFERRLPFRDLVIPIVLPGGMHCWIRTSGVPVYDEEREPDNEDAFRGYRCMASDITSIEHARMRLAQQERQSAMGQLVGGMAHDFNNVLTGIIGFSALLQEDLKSDEKKCGLLRRISEGGHRAKDVIERLLSFARRSNAAPERLRLADVANEVLLLVQCALPTSFRIKTSFDISNETVLIAQSELIRLVVELCANAGDAYGSSDNHGEGKIITLSIERVPSDDSSLRLLAKSALTSQERVSFTTLFDGSRRAFLSHLDPSRSYIRVLVADEGSGIEADILPRVIEPYFSTKDVGRGSGLGFSVVHGIVLAAEGAICLTTGRNKGTEVEVFLPVVQSDASARAP